VCVFVCSQCLIACKQPIANISLCEDTCLLPVSRDLFHSLFSYDTDRVYDISNKSEVSIVKCYGCHFDDHFVFGQIFFQA